MFETSMKLSLENHLQYNHFPPVSLDFVEIAERAIDACNAEDFHRPIDLPNGRCLTAIDIVEGLHLTDYIEWSEA